MVRKIYSLLALLLFAGLASAQSGAGTLKGKVTDAGSGEPLPFVNVIVLSNGNQAGGGSTDFDGNYSIKPIDPGTYSVQFSFVGYQSKQVNGVVINGNKISFLSETLSEGVALQEAEIVEYKVPLIDKDGGATGGTVTREDIDKMPGRSATSIAATVGGVSSAGNDDGSVSVRGARSGGTFYYIDGIKVRGSTNLPKNAIEEVSVITGGVPANYGDATGGIISITTRGASSFYFGGVEVISSGMRFGDDGYVGLDQFGYNLFEGFLSGPLLSKKNEDGSKGDPLLGFFLSGNYTDLLDTRPTFGGVYSITPEARESIINDPIRVNVSEAGNINGILYNTDFLGEESFTRVSRRQNNRSRQASLAGKIDIATTPTVDFTVGGSGAFSSNNDFSRAGSLMNWENNIRNTSFDWRAYARLSQRFLAATDEETAQSSTLKNVFYTVMLDYSSEFERREDVTHKDNFFRYGHVGTFDTFSRYSYDYDQDAGAFIQTGIEDTLVVFTPSEFNPTLAAINSAYFDLLGPDYALPTNNPGISLPDGQYNQFVPETPYSNLDVIQGNGALRNGDVPSDIYSIWDYPGGQANAYSIENFTQSRLTAAGSADIGDHAIQVGFEYEQRRDSRFGLAPRGLWTIGRQYVNSHIEVIDENSIQDVTNIGSEQYITYDVLIGDNQFAFDRNLRTSLGLNPDGGDLIDIDAINPDELSIDMFSADDLLNQGNALVSYYGYDHTGKRIRGSRPSLEDFFNDTDDEGYNTRAIGAYEPIYIAGYVMDKFSFDDIIFNVGVRIDRFDANQPVLKDPFVVGDAFTASEVTEFGEHPNNIGDDYTVYVDDLEDPSRILGYRTGNTWFNSSGTIIDDPSNELASSNTRPAPYLREVTDQVTSSAFRDYDPAINVMPRISFSFPISDEAVFFAHYDILTQRPTFANRFDPIDYLFIENGSNEIGNPALRPTRTVDYELGFQQVLSKSSSLKISAFYRDLKDMIQVRNFFGAYPNNYIAYDNLDFGTVKGITASFDLRRTGNLWMKANYTLQFADGTGSDANTALALIRAELPNLRQVAPLNLDQRHRIAATIDYRFGEGADYNGPVWFDKPVFQNTGANFIATLGSGTPYTASTIPVPIQGGINAATEGSINGSRLPWNFNLDMQIDKNWTLNFNKGEAENGDAKTANLNVYLWFTNLLNTQNIIGVYRFTGEPDDDGYLAASRYRQEIASQNDPESYRNYYRMRVDDPFNFARPRTVRLGVKLDF